ncbi:UNVERIFIED_CONTAM: hypothetical protein PYX00_010114 [Menopon gallinae]|uniref:Uncharacterized protein n=1 Tax=Menopon gallinae TaxID=328185 RepID=A0AAW2HDY5_9NEOP
MAVISSGVKTQWLHNSLVLISVVLCCVQYSGGFNVDTINFIRYRGDPGSMFGFSVAEHKEYGRSWVLIGAPEAQTIQPGVDHGGAVYKCDTTADDVCEQIPFDVTGNNNNTEGRQVDKKSYQWFGATVRSSGENGIVLVSQPQLFRTCPTEFFIGPGPFESRMVLNEKFG